MRKKLLTLCICFCLLLSALPVSGAAVLSLQNAGFEKWNSTSAPDGGWTVTKGSGSIAAETEDVSEGLYALRLTSAASQTTEMEARQTVTGLTAGKLYELSADFKLPSALPNSFGFCMYVTSAGGGTFLVPAMPPVSHTDSTWMRLAFLFTAPSDGQVRITLLLRPIGKARTLLCDNVELRQAERGTMELYKSPVGYILLDTLQTEAAARERLPQFYSGAAVLSGGADGGKSVLVRAVAPKKSGIAALAAAYKGRRLLDFAAFSFADSSFAAALLQSGTQTLGYFWKKSKLQPADEVKTLSVPMRVTELLGNGDFESYIGSSIPKWDAYKGWDGGFCALITENGNREMKVWDTAGGSQPYVYQRVTVSPGTKYKLSVSCSQSVTTERGAGIKLEFYDRNNQSTGDSTDLIPAGWDYFSKEFETPARTARLTLYLRMYGTGEAYFDNASLTQSAPPAAGSVETDEIFYYPEWLTGTASITANTVAFPSAAGGKADIGLYSGTTALAKVTDKPLSGGACTWQFPVSLMETEGKAYTVRAEIYDADGQSIGVCERDVYKYERPTALDTNGDYRLPDGSLFIPHIVYHVTDYGVSKKYEEAENQYATLSQGGFNVVQLSPGCIYDPAVCIATLDKLQEYGLYALVPLYDNRIPPARSERMSTVRRLITAIRNHPALFAYGVYDEPDIGTDDLTEQELIDSYRLIRDIDKTHPTYTVIAPLRSSSTDIGRFALTKYTDVVCYDPYPACWNDPPSTYVYTVHAQASTHVLHHRPVYSLLQTFDWRGFFPTGDEYRHMWYQAAMGGAKGIGFFSFEDALTTEPKGLWTSPL